MHRVILPSWMVEAGKRMIHFPTIEVPRTAMLVIDMQNYFMVSRQLMENAHARDIVPNVNRLAQTLRTAGALVGDWLSARPGRNEGIHPGENP
jgi:ureidoacrylate peracid hydrolase